jgi:hypothetical protein
MLQSKNKKETDVVSVIKDTHTAATASHNRRLTVNLVPHVASYILSLLRASQQKSWC